MGRITAMPQATHLNNSEFLEIVQQGVNGLYRNYKLPLRDIKGQDGKSAYELAVYHGFEGTYAEWAATLVGKSAYQIWLDLGNIGTEEDFINSLGIKSEWDSKQW